MFYAFNAARECNFNLRDLKNCIFLLTLNIYFISDPYRIKAMKLCAFRRQQQNASTDIFSMNFPTWYMLSKRFDCSKNNWHQFSCYFIIKEAKPLWIAKLRSLLPGRFGVETTFGWHLKWTAAAVAAVASVEHSLQGK